MKKNILILDDNFIIANKIKKRFFETNNTYKLDYGIDLFIHYFEIDNENPENAANVVSNFIKTYDIECLLLDRGFGKIIDPENDNQNIYDKSYVYKDNSIKGYNIEELLMKMSHIKNSGLNNIKSIIVYTYDDYRTINKEGEVIREEILEKLKGIIPSSCEIDVLLTYTSIYKVAGVGLYEAFDGPGIFKLGGKDNFYLYGVFIGELLYHKLIQMINSKRTKIYQVMKNNYILKIFVLFSIITGISIGGNAIFSFFFKSNEILAILASLFLGIIIPLSILLLKPSLLISIND